MDGNRRWARQQGWIPWRGHREGLEAAKRAMSFCIEKNIPYLSLYTFSIENFKRPEDEKHFSFNVLLNEVYKQVDELKQKGIKVKFIGDRNLFPKNVLDVATKVERETETGDKLQVNLLFCYGARQELLSGIKAIAHKLKQGAIKEEDLSEKILEQHLWTHGIPEPEIIVRTGGVKRLSNFLLYQAAYSEFYFLDCYWPELQHEHLEGAINFLEQTKRNFGK